MARDLGELGRLAEAGDICVFLPALPRGEQAGDLLQVVCGEVDRFYLVALWKGYADDIDKNLLYVVDREETAKLLLKLLRRTFKMELEFEFSDLMGFGIERPRDQVDCILRDDEIEWVEMLWGYKGDFTDAPCSVDARGRRVIGFYDRCLRWEAKLNAQLSSTQRATAWNVVEHPVAGPVVIPANDSTAQKQLPSVEAGIAATSVALLPSKHSDDFTSVVWNGERFEFRKGQQAEAVRVLWEAWARGTPTLAMETIGEKIGSDADKFRLALVFRGHPAWGKMIVEHSKGVYKLLESPKNHT